MKHVCPACGRQWECACTDEVKLEHEEKCGGHFVEIACSEHCGEHLASLMIFLARRLFL